MSERIDKLCATADELLMAGDVDGALECFDRALRADVTSARAWTGRATVLADRNRFGEALGCIRRALDESAAYAPAVILEAEVLMKAGRRPDALVRCYEALAADSAIADHWVRRGRLFEELERLDDAAESYAAALAIEDTAVAWCLRAELFTRQGKLEGAAHDFARAVTADPGHLEAWYRLARTYLELRKTSDMKWALERFLALAPEEGPQTSAARKMLADIALRPRADEPAAPEVRAPRQSVPPTPSTSVPPAAPEVPELGVAYRRPSLAPELAVAQREEPAAPTLAVAARRTEPPPAPRPEASFDEGELELTRNTAVTEPPPSRPFYLDEIDQLHAAGKHIEALRRIGPILTRTPDLVDGWLCQARILIALGELDVAVTSLERVTRIDRGHVIALTLMATCWRDLKRPDRALEILQMVLEIAEERGDAALGNEVRAKLAELG